MSQAQKSYYVITFTAHLLNHPCFSLLTINPEHQLIQSEQSSCFTGNSMAKSIDVSVGAMVGVGTSKNHLLS